MNDIEASENIMINANRLKHIKIESVGIQYSASLCDHSGYEIVRGFGETEVEAINDLHANMI